MKLVAFIASIIVVFWQVNVMAEDKPAVSFRSNVAPILLNKCLACHGPKKAEGGYRVDTFQEVLRPGDSGESPLSSAAGHVGELVRRIITQDESERMPADADPLTAKEIDVIKRWVEAGGKFDGDDPALALGLVIPPATYPTPPSSYPHAVPLTAMAFSPDGKFLITAGYHEVLVWNTHDATLSRRITNLGQRIFVLVFTADGKTLAVGCGEPGRSGEVRLVDFASGQIGGVVARTNDVVLDVALRPGTDELAIASADGTIRIVDQKAQKELQVITSHADWVTAVAWSDDGALLASTSRDKSVKVYDGNSRDLIASYAGHGAATRGVSILPDKKQIVSVGDDKKLHRWSVEGAKKASEIALGGEGTKLTRRGNSLLVPCANKRFVQVDLTKNAIDREFSGHSHAVISSGFYPNQNEAEQRAWIASGAFNGEIRLWNTADGATVRHWIAKP